MSSLTIRMAHVASQVDSESYGPISTLTASPQLRLLKTTLLNIHKSLTIKLLFCAIRKPLKTPHYSATNALQ